MLMLTDVLESGLIEGDKLVHVLHVLQGLSVEGEEKQRLLKEWAGRSGRQLQDWMLEAVLLPLVKE